MCSALSSTGVHTFPHQSTGSKSKLRDHNMVVVIPIHSSLWLCCFLLFVLVSPVCGLLCPVSRQYDTNQFYHRYPDYFYQPKVESETLAAYNCNTHYALKNDVLSLCDRNVTLCPVNEENIRSAMSAASWPQYAEVFRLIGEKTDINVFYFGGSMTHGSDTHCRCRCRDTEDSRCPPLSVPAHFESQYCSWPTHLSHWLNHSYPATTFHFHDYTASGRASDSSSHFVQLVHTSSAVANFSHPALFFLDYSVNDVHKMTSIHLETFVRTIYDNFGRHYNVRPTVILLEQYPFATFHNTAQSASNTDYWWTYRTIAERYNLILLSLREVYWTYFGLPQDRNVTHPDPSKR